MAKTIRRELLTDLLLARLRSALETGGSDEVLVGDHAAPDDGGWPDDEGKGTFVNYVVLTGLASSEPLGSMGKPQEIVVWPYALTCIGVSRRGAENASDRARAALVGLVRADTSDSLRVQYVREAGYGGIERVDIVEPPFYAVTDTVHVFTSQS